MNAAVCPAATGYIARMTEQIRGPFVECLLDGIAILLGLVAAKVRTIIADIEQ